MKTLTRYLLSTAVIAAIVTITFTTSASGGGDAKSQLKSARASLHAAKRSLGDAMDCCMEPACDFCALAIEKCPCGANIKAGKPICGTCADGWAAGLGDVPNIDKGKIKRFTPAMAKAMFDKRYARDK